MTTKGTRRRLLRWADPVGLRAHPACPPRQRDQPGVLVERNPHPAAGRARRKNHRGAL